MKQPDRAAALALTPVSPATEARLDRYVALLQHWQAKTNLVGRSTLEHVWTRHVCDSLQLLTIAPEVKIWADFGSGGGFPGVVLACAMADIEGGRVHLVERNSKKAAFLREAVRVTGAAATIYPRDIVDYANMPDIRIDCVTARALAPLNKLLIFAEPLLVNGVRALFQKGQDVGEELTIASKYWSLEYTLRNSVTGPGVIVDITKASRRAIAASQYDT